MIGGVLFDGADPECWGFILGFLDEDDPRPAKEQFNEKYLGGWFPFKYFDLVTSNMTLVFNGEQDPEDGPPDLPLFPLSMIQFREEMLLLYPHDWVVIIQNDDTWEVARMN